MRLAPIKIVRGDLEQLNPGEVVITLNIKTTNLDYLTSKTHGYQYFSKDEKALADAAEETYETSNNKDNLDTLLDASEEDELGEDAERNIVESVEGDEVKKSVLAAYKMAGMRVPRRFTSMAERIQGFPASNVDLAPYGDVVVVVDPKQVKNDLVVFSGDVKTLGHALFKGQGSYAKAWRIKNSVGTLANQLRSYREYAQLVKRTVGRYFEARLTRALKVTDISKIYVPDGDKRAWKAADKINTLKLQKAENRSRRLSPKRVAATQSRTRQGKASSAQRRLPPRPAFDEAT